LPVIVEFAIDNTVSIADYEDPFLVQVYNPIENILTIELQLNEADQYTIEVYSIDGKLLLKNKNYFESGNSIFQIPFDLPSSLYIIKLQNSKKQTVVKKAVKF
jgi:hypothetical protein